MKKLSIEELKEKLNYNDLRPIRNWCQKNDVLIIRYGKSEFVFVENFEEACINLLKTNNK